MEDLGDDILRTLVHKMQRLQGHPKKRLKSTWKIRRSFKDLFHPTVRLERIIGTGLAFSDRHTSDQSQVGAETTAFVSQTKTIKGKSHRGVSKRKSMAFLDSSTYSITSGTNEWNTNRSQPNALTMNTDYDINPVCVLPDKLTLEEQMPDIVESDINVTNALTGPLDSHHIKSIQTESPLNETKAILSGGAGSVQSTCGVYPIVKLKKLSSDALTRNIPSKIYEKWGLFPRKDCEDTVPTVNVGGNPSTLLTIERSEQQGEKDESSQLTDYKESLQNKSQLINNRAHSNVLKETVRVGDAAKKHAKDRLLFISNGISGLSEKHSSASQCMSSVFKRREPGKMYAGKRNKEPPGTGLSDSDKDWDIGATSAPPIQRVQKKSKQRHGNIGKMDSDRKKDPIATDEIGSMPRVLMTPVKERDNQHCCSGNVDRDKIDGQKNIPIEVRRSMVSQVVENRATSDRVNNDSMVTCNVAMAHDRGDEAGKSNNRNSGLTLVDPVVDKTETKSVPRRKSRRRRLTRPVPINIVQMVLAKGTITAPSSLFSRRRQDIQTETKSEKKLVHNKVPIHRDSSEHNNVIIHSDSSENEVDASISSDSQDTVRSKSGHDNISADDTSSGHAYLAITPPSSAVMDVDKKLCLRSANSCISSVTRKGEAIDLTNHCDPTPTKRNPGTHDMGSNANLSSFPGQTIQKTMTKVFANNVSTVEKKAETSTLKRHPPHRATSSEQTSYDFLKQLIDDGENVTGKSNKRKKKKRRAPSYKKVISKGSTGDLQTGKQEGELKDKASVHLPLVMDCAQPGSDLQKETASLHENSSIVPNDGFFQPVLDDLGQENSDSDATIILDDKYDIDFIDDDMKSPGVNAELRLRTSTGSDVIGSSPAREDHCFSGGESKIHSRQAALEGSVSWSVVPTPCTSIREQKECSSEAEHCKNKDKIDDSGENGDDGYGEEPLETVFAGQTGPVLKDNIYHNNHVVEESSKQSSTEHGDILTVPGETLAVVEGTRPAPANVKPTSQLDTIGIHVTEDQCLPPVQDQIALDKSSQVTTKSFSKDKIIDVIHSVDRNEDLTKLSDDSLECLEVADHHHSANRVTKLSPVNESCPSVEAPTVASTRQRKDRKGHHKRINRDSDDARIYSYYKPKARRSCKKGAINKTKNIINQTKQDDVHFTANKENVKQRKPGHKSPHHFTKSESEVLINKCVDVPFDDGNDPKNETTETCNVFPISSSVTLQGQSPDTKHFSKAEKGKENEACCSPANRDKAEGIHGSIHDRDINSQQLANFAEMIDIMIEASLSNEKATQGKQTSQDVIVYEKDPMSKNVEQMLVDNSTFDKRYEDKSITPVPLTKPPSGTVLDGTASCQLISDEDGCYDSTQIETRASHILLCKKATNDKLKSHSDEIKNGSVYTLVDAQSASAECQTASQGISSIDSSYIPSAKDIDLPCLQAGELDSSTDSTVKTPIERSSAPRVAFYLDAYLTSASESITKEMSIQCYTTDTPIESRQQSRNENCLTEHLQTKSACEIGILTSESSFSQSDTLVALAEVSSRPAHYCTNSYIVAGVDDSVRNDGNAATKEPCEKDNYQQTSTASLGQCVYADENQHENEDNIGSDKCCEAADRTPSSQNETDLNNVPSTNDQHHCQMPEEMQLEPSPFGVKGGSGETAIKTKDKTGHRLGIATLSNTVPLHTEVVSYENEKNTSLNSDGQSCIESNEIDNYEPCSTPPTPCQDEIDIEDEESIVYYQGAIPIGPIRNIGSISMAPLMSLAGNKQQSSTPREGIKTILGNSAECHHLLSYRNIQEDEIPQGVDTLTEEWIVVDEVIDDEVLAEVSSPNNTFNVKADYQLKPILEEKHVYHRSESPSCISAAVLEVLNVILDQLVLTDQCTYKGDIDIDYVKANEEYTTTGRPIMTRLPPLCQEDIANQRPLTEQSMSPSYFSNVAYESLDSLLNQLDRAIYSDVSSDDEGTGRTRSTRKNKAKKSKIPISKPNQNNSIRPRASDFFDEEDFIESANHRSCPNKDPVNASQPHHVNAGDAQYGRKSKWVEYMTKDPRDAPESVVKADPSIFYSVIDDRVVDILLGNTSNCTTPNNEPRFGQYMTNLSSSPVVIIGEESGSSSPESVVIEEDYFEEEDPQDILELLLRQNNNYRATNAEARTPVADQDKEQGSVAYIDHSSSIKECSPIDVHAKIFLTSNAESIIDGIVDELFEDTVKSIDAERHSIADRKIVCEFHDIGIKKANKSRTTQVCSAELTPPCISNQTIDRPPSSEVTSCDTDQGNIDEEVIFGNSPPMEEMNKVRSGIVVKEYITSFPNIEGELNALPSTKKEGEINRISVTRERNSSPTVDFEKDQLSAALNRGDTRYLFVEENKKTSPCLEDWASKAVLSPAHSLDDTMISIDPPENTENIKANQIEGEASLTIVETSIAAPVMFDSASQIGPLQMERKSNQQKDLVTQFPCQSHDKSELLTNNKRNLNKGQKSSVIQGSPGRVVQEGDGKEKTSPTTQDCVREITSICNVDHTTEETRSMSPVIPVDIDRKERNKTKCAIHVGYDNISQPFEKGKGFLEKIVHENVTQFPEIDAELNVPSRRKSDKEQLNTKVNRADERACLLVERANTFTCADKFGVKEATHSPTAADGTVADRCHKDNKTLTQSKTNSTLNEIMTGKIASEMLGNISGSQVGPLLLNKKTKELQTQLEERETSTQIGKHVQKACIVQKDEESANTAIDLYTMQNGQSYQCQNVEGLKLRPLTNLPIAQLEGDKDKSSVTKQTPINECEVGDERKENKSTSVQVNFKESTDNRILDCATDEAKCFSPSTRLDKDLEKKKKVVVQDEIDITSNLAERADEENQSNFPAINMELSETFFQMEDISAPNRRKRSASPTIDVESYQVSAKTNPSDKKSSLRKEGRKSSTCTKVLSSAEVPLLAFPVTATLIDKPDEGNNKPNLKKAAELVVTDKVHLPNTPVNPNFLNRGVVSAPQLVPSPTKRKEAEMTTVCSPDVQARCGNKHEQQDTRRKCASVTKQCPPNDKKYDSRECETWQKNQADSQTQLKHWKRRLLSGTDQDAYKKEDNATLEVNFSDIDKAHLQQQSVQVPSLKVIVAQVIKKPKGSCVQTMSSSDESRTSVTATRHHSKIVPSNAEKLDTEYFTIKSVISEMVNVVHEYLLEQESLQANELAVTPNDKLTINRSAIEHTPQRLLSRVMFSSSEDSEDERLVIDFGDSDTDAAPVVQGLKPHGLIVNKDKAEVSSKSPSPNKVLQTSPNETKFLRKGAKKRKNLERRREGETGIDIDTKSKKMAKTMKQGALIKQPMSVNPIFPSMQNMKHFNRTGASEGFLIPSSQTFTHREAVEIGNGRINDADVQANKTKESLAMNATGRSSLEHLLVHPVSTSAAQEPFNTIASRPLTSTSVASQIRTPLANPSLTHGSDSIDVKTAQFYAVQKEWARQKLELEKLDFIYKNNLNQSHLVREKMTNLTNMLSFTTKYLQQQYHVFRDLQSNPGHPIDEKRPRTAEATIAIPGRERTLDVESVYGTASNQTPIPFTAEIMSTAPSTAWAKNVTSIPCSEINVTRDVVKPPVAQRIRSVANNNLAPNHPETQTPSPIRPGLNNTRLGALGTVSTTSHGLNLQTMQARPIDLAMQWGAKAGEMSMHHDFPNRTMSATAFPPIGGIHLYPSPMKNHFHPAQTNILGTSYSSCVAPPLSLPQNGTSVKYTSYNSQTDKLPLPPSAHNREASQLTVVVDHPPKAHSKAPVNLNMFHSLSCAKVKQPAHRRHLHELEQSRGGKNGRGRDRGGGRIRGRGTGSRRGKDTENYEGQERSEQVHDSSVDTEADSQFRNPQRRSASPSAECAANVLLELRTARTTPLPDFQGLSSRGSHLEREAIAKLPLTQADRLQSRDMSQRKETPERSLVNPVPNMHSTPFDFIESELYKIKNKELNENMTEKKGQSSNVLHSRVVPTTCEYVNLPISKSAYGTSQVAPGEMLRQADSAKPRHVRSENTNFKKMEGNLQKPMGTSKNGKAATSRQFVCAPTKRTAAIPCGSCGQRAIFLCSGCQLAAYCSIRCQAASWESHRRSCNFQA